MTSTQFLELFASLTLQLTIVVFVTHWTRTARSQRSSTLHVKRASRVVGHRGDRRVAGGRVSLDTARYAGLSPVAMVPLAEMVIRRASRRRCAHPRL